MVLEDIVGQAAMVDGSMLTHLLGHLCPLKSAPSLRSGTASLPLIPRSESDPSLSRQALPFRWLNVFLRQTPALPPALPLLLPFPVSMFIYADSLSCVPHACSNSPSKFSCAFGSLSSPRCTTFTEPHGTAANSVVRFS